MQASDEIRLRHMLDAAREALAFAAGRERFDLDRNRMLVLSLVKDIEIIGEAASKVSEPVRARLSQVPWLDIIGMRNRLIHAYFDIDLNILWDVVRHDLPCLADALDEVLSPPSG